MQCHDRRSLVLDFANISVGTWTPDTLQDHAPACEDEAPLCRTRAMLKSSFRHLYTFRSSLIVFVSTRPRTARRQALRQTEPIGTQALTPFLSAVRQE